jgi:sugar phosphate isomerase/epimerase
MRKWSLGQLTVVGVRPFELVEIAARAGYDAVDPLVGLVDFPEIPTVPLKAGDPDTIRMAQALKANGIAFNVADAFVLNAQTDLEALRRMVDLVAELGAKSINAIHFDDDRPRGFANLAALDAMAREAGLPVVIEYLKFSQIGTAQEALEAIAAIGSGNMGLMCDPLHHFFAGGTTEEMHGYTASILAAQLCDGPADPSFEEYVRMAMGDRLLPGDGALPLTGYMAALPPELMCAIEVPLPAEKDLLRRATMALEAGKAVDR